MHYRMAAMSDDDWLSDEQLEEALTHRERMRLDPTYRKAQEDKRKREQELNAYANDRPL